MHGLPRIVAILGVLFIIDRVVKTLVYHIGSFFVFSLSQNFSWLSIGGSRTLALVVSGMVIVIILLYIYLVRGHSSNRELYAFGAITLGGVSNFFDRALYGGVIDYISVARVSFNIADIGIMGGVCFLLYHHFYSKGLREGT